MAEEKKPRGTQLAPSQDHAQWKTMVKREVRALGLDGRSPRGGEFITPFAAGGTFANVPPTRKKKMKLTLPKDRPITGASGTRRTSRTGRTGRTSRSSRSTSRSSALLNTGRSSMCSISSSASNLTEIAMNRIDKLEQMLENERRKREAAERE